jgi:uncharacterized membrane protein
VDLSLLRDCVINWWPFPAAALLCAWLGRKRWRGAAQKGRPRLARFVATGWIISAMVLMTVITPQAVNLQRKYRTAHSVTLSAASLTPAPSLFDPTIAAFVEATDQGVRYISVAGIHSSPSTGNQYLVLGRIERNRNTRQDLQRELRVHAVRWGDRSLLGPGSVTVGCGDAVVPGSRNAAAQRVCQWRHGGSTGLLIPVPRTTTADPIDDYQTMIIEAQAITSTVLTPSLSRYHPFQASGLLFLQLALAALVVIVSISGHELSHAVVARLVGSEVLGVTIGVGRVVWQHKIGGVEVRWCSLPLGGHVRHRRTTARQTRWRPMAIAAAGPSFNVATGVALVAIHAGPTLPLIAVGLGVVNLIPYSVVLPEIGVRVGTDGYQMLQAFRRGDTRTPTNSACA